MISLHSCFVAGLTLMYCLWRDRSLFSFDVLEASRACSLSLTIFGEKWPGAVKYRDIFDALSGSLFKAIINPDPATGSQDQTQAHLGPLRVDLDTDPSALVKDTMATSIHESNLNEAQPEAQPQTQPSTCPGTRASKPTMVHMVSDAVKEAFMEVDEEAPGGWQGWKMWNEMVMENENCNASQPANFGPEDFTIADQRQPFTTWWSGHESNSMFSANINMLQQQQNSQAQGIEQYGNMETGEWSYAHFVPQ